MFEIEMKARIDRPADLRQTLSEGARFLGEWIKKDRYFTRKGATEASFGFRLRELIPVEAAAFSGETPPAAAFPSESGLGEGKETPRPGCWVTYKERRWEKECEVNREIEFSVGDGRAFAAFAAALGFESDFCKCKHTYAYEAEGITHELNEVEGLGWFLELEVLSPDSAKAGDIRHLLTQRFRQLGIEAGQVVDKSYRTLLKEAER